MLIEVVINMKNPDRFDADAFWESIVRWFDRDAVYKMRLTGGFSFTTKRTPVRFLRWVEDEAFSITAFETICFHVLED